MTGHGNSLFGGNLTFDHRAQEWCIFKSRFLQYCLANDINDDTDKAKVKRRALLLTSLVEDTYRVVRDLATPAPLEELHFSTLVEKLDQHFGVKKCTFAERFKFYKAEQRPGEDLAEWAARVRSLAQYCGFKAELETALRDKFVLGLENIREKEKLFAECIDNLTFNKALELAQGVRCAREALQASRAAGGSGGGAGGSDFGQAAQPMFAIQAKPSKPYNNGSSYVLRKSCSVCGYRNHTKDQCRFVNYACEKCNVKGHLKRMCKSDVKNMKFLDVDYDDTVEGKYYNLFSIKCHNGEPMQQLMSIAGQLVSCEVDSGCAVSVLPNYIFKDCFKNQTLEKCSVVLNCYNGSKITPLGFVSLPITFEGRTESLAFYIVDTLHKQPALLGRDFISTFKLQLCNINCNNLRNEDLLIHLKNKFPLLFSEGLGKFNKHKITLKINKDAQLRFFKPRTVPLALREKVEKELDRLVSLGILEKVDHAEIASPIVPVLRPDGNIRICGDYSVTLNKVLYMDNYPLPRIEDLFARLHGGTEFSKLDLSRAYNQVELDETKKMTCINTHKGLYCYNRLVFGLCNAPSIFQKILEEVLVDIEGTCIFLDDILITAPNKTVHMQRLEQVLGRLQDAGFKLQVKKCELFKESVEYLGFIIDKNGLRKSNGKVEAILKCERPKNVNEIKSFLGMINYYRCFVPNASSVLAPLHMLLKKGTKWFWGKEQDAAFEQIKRELLSERVLAHYDPELPTLVTADAGPRGLGAVLAQRQRDGSERVVAYASRSLTKPEYNYAQIQKEAVAIIFAIKKFHHYLYGRTSAFILRTDHKPLLSIFGSKKGVPEMAANRLQRYALFLSAYNFKIEYVKSENNVADFLSRSVANANNQSENELMEDQDSTLYINHIAENMLKPITINDIIRETARDETLRKVVNLIRNGWATKPSCKDLKPFYLCRMDLSIENDCILRGHKVVIPKIFREQLLNELHSSHFGIVKTKSEARSRMWWPNIDQHIEEKIGSCSICNTLRYAPPRSPLSPWPYPTHPWERVHLDMFTLVGKQYLIAVDAHSKWVECFQMQKTDSEAVLSKLTEMFSRFGSVRTLVTDNASNFTSSQFKDFCTFNGITHLTSPAYHPASNGQAENTVKTIKRGLKIILTESTHPKVINKKFLEFLFSYRNSVHCATGFSPAQLLIGRPLRNRLDLLRPSSLVNETAAVESSSTARNNVIDKQISQNKNYGGHRKTNFTKGDKVLIKHFYNNGTKFVWKIGTISKKIGNTTYEVFVPELNSFFKKHIDHILRYTGENENSEDDLCLHGTYIQNSHPEIGTTLSSPQGQQISTSMASNNDEQGREDSDSSFCSASPTHGRHSSDSECDPAAGEQRIDRDTHQSSSDGMRAVEGAISEEAHMRPDQEQPEFLISKRSLRSYKNKNT